MNLQEAAEIIWLRLVPKGSDDSATTKEEVIASARYYYATLMWTSAKNERNTEGFYDVPSYLLTEVEKDVIENAIDVSDLKAIKSLPNEGWLLNIGGLTCDCDYVKTTAKKVSLLCEDEVFEGMKLYYIVGDKIKFPKGAHKDTLSIIYANNGSELSPLIYIDESVGGLLLDKLADAYNVQRIAKEDITNNTSSVS